MSWAEKFVCNMPWASMACSGQEALDIGIQFVMDTFGSATLVSLGLPTVAPDLSSLSPDLNVYRDQLSEFQKRKGQATLKNTVIKNLKKVDRDMVYEELKSKAADTAKETIMTEFEAQLEDLKADCLQQ